MRGREKAALLLAMLGPQQSSAVLRRLPQDYAKKLASTVSNLPSPDPATLPVFLDEISRYLVQAQSKTVLTTDSKEADMQDHVDAAQAAKPELRLKPEDIRSLSDLTPAMLWEALAEERPQTVAFFSRHLLEETRDALLATMPQDKAAHVKQSPVFDHDLTKTVFTELSDYVIRFWKDKLNPDKTPTPLFAS